MIGVDHAEIVAIRAWIQIEMFADPATNEAKLVRDGRVLEVPAGRLFAEVIGPTEAAPDLNQREYPAGWPRVLRDERR